MVSRSELDERDEAWGQRQAAQNPAEERSADTFDSMKRTQAETALRDSEQRLGGVVNSAMDAIISVDAQQRIVLFNPAAENMFGLSAAEAVGYPLERLIPARFRRAHEQHIRDFAQTGITSRQMGALGEVSGLRANGEEFPIEASIAQVPVADGKMFLVILRDITERKRTEGALRQLNETLEQQVAERTAVAEQRARDLRRLAAELSEAEHRERERLAKFLHDDLQQLLVAVKLRLAELGQADPRQFGQNIERITDLVGQCLSTSRDLTRELSPPIIQHGTLPEVVEWLGEWFGEKHGLTVAFESAGEIPPVPKHLRVFLFQAVRELLLNVVKHSGSMKASVSLSSAQAHLVLQLEDTGKGFNPQTVNANLNRPGGVGLFHVRERVEALGGRLEIEATSAGGARFRLIVPWAEVAEPPEDASPLVDETTRSQPSVSLTAGGAFRLLVVDDHAVVRAGFVELLNRQSEFDVVGEAASGVEAIEENEVLRPDAIIMDINMPEMDGIEATRRIKQRWPGVVIVGLSFHEEPSVLRDMTESGADAYVSKNAPAGEVIDAIRRACTRDAIGQVV